MKTYIAPRVVDRGSVLARTLGTGTHKTLETGTGFRSSSLAGFGDTDPSSGNTYERNSLGTVIVTNGTSLIVAETAGDAD